MEIRFLVTILLTIVTLVGCAPKRYVAEQPLLIISNQSGKKIKSIEVKGCDEDNSSFKPIAVNISSGRVIQFMVERPCIDARAMNDEGLLIASQSSLSLPPKVRWTIY